MLRADVGTIPTDYGGRLMKDRLAGIDPGPVRFGDTGWRTVRSSWALMSNEKPLIDPESCEMTVTVVAASQRTPPTC